MAISFILVVLIILNINFQVFKCSDVPLVINTWGFSEATQKAWDTIQVGGSGLDALVEGCSLCERLQCDTTVGYGGSPDENGETTLDALIFDGATMNMGAIGGVRRIKNVIALARHVLENTEHSLLVGDLAAEFAVKMGFKEESLSTDHSKKQWQLWQQQKCQPNFWTNVEPDPRKSCGPYHPISQNSVYYEEKSKFSSSNHDTIGMIVIDKNHHVVAGTSTNGATFKIPGRVGDSPIPGAGAYAENGVGAAVATGDGDVMMRFLPSFVAVEELRRGKTPKEAATIAVKRIVDKYSKFFGGVVVANHLGEYSAACNGMDVFKFSVINKKTGKVVITEVEC